MDSGIVAARYARALLKYSTETGDADKVYGQIRKLVSIASGMPSLKDAVLRHRELSPDKKISLMESAVGEPLEDGFARFVMLVHSHRRMNLMLRIFLSFMQQYRNENNVKAGTLVTAVPDEGLKEKMTTLISGRTGARVDMEMKTDPSIIGGFVLEMDGCRLDASAAGRLRAIRHELLDDGNRIV